MKKNKIPIPIYGGNLIIIKTKDLTKLNKKFDIDFSKDHDGGAFKIKDKPFNFYVAFNKKYTGEIIAHESVHLANMIFSNARAEPDFYNDEPYAYLVGWIFSKIEKALNNEDK